MFKKILFCSLLALSTSKVTLAQKYKAVITTNQGKIEMILFDKTPLHRDNFVKLAKEKFYDGILFHRVIPEFMIQGGDPNSKNAQPGQMLGSGSIGDRIPAEFVPEYFHQKGALAAARDNNPEKASSSCQFYIVVGKKWTEEELSTVAQRANLQYTTEQVHIYTEQGGTPHLDGNYTVYGQVTKGMDVVEKIVNKTRDSRDRPEEDQKIEKLRVKKKLLFFWI